MISYSYGQSKAMDYIPGAETLPLRGPEEEEEIMEEERPKDFVDGEWQDDEYDMLKERMEILEAKLGEYESKFEAISKFENIATEAIDTLASNTVSNFKPEAKAVSTPTVTGSIFSQLKTKRGL
jgi:archaellum component FlaC